MKETIVNKTPHAVNILDSRGGLIRRFPLSLSPFRLQVESKRHYLIDGIPTCITNVYKGTVPKHSIGKYYIVSLVIKRAYSNRRDFLVPSELVRDTDGNIIGCQSLGR